MRQRIIKFRGKRKVDNKWLYGSLVEVDGSRYIVGEGNLKQYLSGKTKIWACTDIPTVMRSVNPDTIGQFTGFADKNGKEIWEGDVARLSLYDGIHNCAVVWGERNGKWILQVDDGAEESMWHGIAGGGEVVGNIHDNPTWAKEERKKRKVWLVRTLKIVTTNTGGKRIDFTDDVTEYTSRKMAEEAARVYGAGRTDCKFVVGNSVDNPDWLGR